jgi:hypothetical protein
MSEHEHEHNEHLHKHLTHIEHLIAAARTEEDRRFDRLEHRIDYIERELHKLTHPSHRTFPTDITFQENNMNPTEAGQTQVFTGTLDPAGSSFPADTTFTLTSNDPAVAPTVDATGLVVSVTYPDGWVESATPLEFAYEAASVSAGASISATITPSAPVVVGGAFPTGIIFAQTT